MNNSPIWNLVGGFWAEDQRAHFSPAATRLFFYLVYEANKRYWKGPLHLSWNHLRDALGIKSKKQLASAISDLRSRGVITYRAEKRKGKTCFWFPKHILEGAWRGPYTEPPNQQLVPIGTSQPQSGPHRDQMGDQMRDQMRDQMGDQYIYKDIKDNKDIKDEGIYNNIPTHSGVLKDVKKEPTPPLKKIFLPSECRGIPCGKILELYSFYFARPIDKLSKTTAQWLRERYIENPDLDWKDFLRFVAEKNKAYTLNQIVMSRVFYALLSEYKQEKESEALAARIAERVKQLGYEDQKRRNGKMLPLRNVIGFGGGSG